MTTIANSSSIRVADVVEGGVGGVAQLRVDAGDHEIGTTIKVVGDHIEHLLDRPGQFCGQRLVERQSVGSFDPGGLPVARR